MTALAWEDIARRAARILDPEPEPLPDQLQVIYQLQPKQQLAEQLTEQVDDLLYGGAAGGGKSFWLIAHMIRQCIDHPNNRVVIFRRVYPSLRRTVIGPLTKLLRGYADYNGAEHQFRFPNGSVLELGHLQHADEHTGSHTAYQGAEYGCIAFEELTEFAKHQVDYLRARLRAPAPGVRPHMIATTNPGGRGHRWVKRRYIKPAADDLAPGQANPAPGEPWTPRPTDHDPDPISRAFLPATLADNPILTSRDPSYIRRLRAITNTKLRRAMEHGDWDAIDAVEGALWHPDQIDVRRVRAHPDLSRVVVAVDPPGGHKTSNAECGIVAAGRAETINSPAQTDSNGKALVSRRGYVLADRSRRATPEQWARAAILLWAETDADAIVAERNHGGDMVESVIRSTARLMHANGELLVAPESIRVRTVTATRGKRLRAEPVAALYGDPEDPDSWDAGLVYHVGDLPELESQMVTWTDEDAESPDRLDALVWALTDLMVQHAGGSRSIRVRRPR